MILNASYVFDEGAKECANREGRNYWWAYIAEILSRLGLTATSIPPREIAECLTKTSLHFLDDIDASPLLNELETWVKGGGTLVGCNTEDLDQIFGNRFPSIKEQQGDEPAIWMMKTGIKADNSFAHRRSPPLDPRNLVGFIFGTSFPHFFWSDFRYRNERIDFLELPVVAYEVGYSYAPSSSRDEFEKREIDILQLKKALMLAKHYNMIMCLFYHPVYLARVPSCRRCIDKLLSILQEDGIEALHLGTDEVVRWWKSRSMVRIDDVHLEGDVLRFRSSCPYPDGCIAKISIGDLEPLRLKVRSKVENKFGNRWLLLLIPSGENVITIHLKPDLTVLIFQKV